MENFDISQTKTDSIEMSVSSVFVGDSGEKYAFVTFSDGVRSAEGRIPECKIISNKGFAAIEVESLERYMNENLKQLKKMAANINILKAL